MSYNPFASHRNYNYLCQFYNRVADDTVYGENPKLVYPSTPSGIFYAKPVDTEGREAVIFGNMQMPYGTIVIETPDYVSLEKNDRVIYNNKTWLVQDTMRTPIIKTTKYNVNGGSYNTLIALRN